LVCFLAAGLQSIGLSPVVTGWLALLVFAFNFIVLVHDFDQKRFIIFVLALFVTALLIWIVNLYGFTFLKSFAQWLLGFQPSLSTDAYLMLGSLLLLLFLWGIALPIFSYWRLEPNEFVHFTQPIGRDMSIARAGCSVFKEVPDIFEYLLSFGGGTLVIRRNEQTLASIPHIPFLGARMPAIEHLLAETRVVMERTES